MTNRVDIRVPGERVVADGRGFRASEVTCTAGPDDRPFEEEHAATSVSVVLDGVFSYRSGLGRATMTPGALLLANHGAAYRCSHAVCRGDRCLSLQFSADLVEEAAADLGLRHPRFVRPRLAAAPARAGLIDSARRLAADRLDAAATEVLAVDLLAAALGGEADEAASVSLRDERRIAALLDHLDRRLDEPLRLDDLGALVGLGRYQFLRVFRRVVGTTPHAYLIAARLRRAAVALERGDGRVLDVALAAGFSDLSEFTRRFHAAFGLPPAAWRRRMR